MRMFVLIMTLTAVPAGGVGGGVIDYWNKAEWQAAVGHNYTTIDFTGYPELTFITTQYSALGVIFPEGNDNIDLAPIYLNDGAGLHDGLDNSITVLFSSPMNWIAVDFPGIVEIELYWNDDPIYSSDFGQGGAGQFGGMISSQPFDKAVLTGNGVIIDDLHFGPPIPAPGALAVLALGSFVMTTRRRRYQR